MFYEKPILKNSQYSQEKNCAEVSLKICRPSGEILRNFKNTYFGKHLRTVGSQNS